MRATFLYLFFIIFLGGCSVFEPIQETFITKQQQPVHISNAIQYINLNENSNRSELKDLMGIDPVRIEWCAGFLNAVLDEVGKPGAGSVSEHPLLARSFLKWGESVDDNPKEGDIIVFPRGNQGWQGHVGIYLYTVTRDGIDYFAILGGNQDNSVNVQLFRSGSEIGIRRYIEKG